MSSKVNTRPKSNIQVFNNTFNCPICGLSPVRGDGFQKHVKSRMCLAVQERNVSSQSQNVLQAQYNCSTNKDPMDVPVYTNKEMKKLSLIAKELDLPPCDTLIKLGRRYVYMNNYVIKRSMAVNFSLSLFLMNSPKEAINRPRNLVVIDSPSGSILDALTLLVSSMLSLRYHLCFLFSFDFVYL